MPRAAIDPVRIVDEWVEGGTVKAASLQVMLRGETVLKHDAGLAAWSGGERPVAEDTLFMIASITKTLTAACFMQYVEEGVLALGDSPADFIPEFGREGKDKITFLHMLTHTSGLHEQVPGKDELRRREGPMAEFLDLIYASVPLFASGKGRAYSNCAFGMMARVVELIERRPFGAVLRERIFEPLGMRDSALGFDESWDARLAEIELPPGEEADRAFVNSRYWRGLGAAWGAMASNTGDLLRFAEMMRRGGELEGAQVLSGATVATMTRDHLHCLPGFPREACAHPWGLSWNLRGRGPGRFFGDLTSPESFGHTGATGTFLWVDPARDMAVCLLSNKEQGNDAARFARLSNAVVAHCAASSGRPGRKSKKDGGKHRKKT